MIHAYILDIAKDEKIQKVSADSAIEMLEWLNYQIPSFVVSVPEIEEGFTHDVDNKYTIKVWGGDAHTMTIDVDSESVDDDDDEPVKPARRKRIAQS